MAAPKVSTFTTGLEPLPAENVDTDQIVPARYLKVIDKAGLADALFHDWRFEADGSKKNPPFVIDEPRYAGHGILVAPSVSRRSSQPASPTSLSRTR